MTRDEIVTALRCCEQRQKCEGACPLIAEVGCIEKAMGYAADLIENQQRHIEALMKDNDSLKDAIARRDKQIEDMNQGMAQLANVDQQAKNLKDWGPVRHGRWVDKPLIKSFKHTNIPVVECSACGIDFCDIINNHYFMYKYCPNCGCRMDGGADNG